MIDLQKQFISQKDLAQMLGVSVYALNAMRYKGRLKGLPYVKWGTQYKFPLDEVKQWMKEQVQVDTGDYYGNK